ncbi:hypothetical protein ACLOJK_017167 [Asimina triloba]
MITRLTQCGSAKDAVELFIEMEVSGLVNMYVKCAVDGSVEASMRVFDQMLMHDVMSWTAIITGYVQSGGRDKETIELFCTMKQEGVQPYQFTFSTIAGCSGVLHVASPYPAGSVPNPEVDLIEPAVTGTLNVLKACSEVGVKRVVVVSSGGAVVFTPHWPKDKAMDERCWSDEEYCRTSGNWYFLSKTLAERAALQYGEKSGLHVVTVCPAVMFGPQLQSTVNATNLFLLKTLRGEQETVENRALVIADVRDVADALIIAYEKPEASVEG